MTPARQIIANGTDITAQINDRLSELSITDEAGMKADALIIRLDDRDGVVELPRDGAELRVSMGYKETSLTFMGAFLSDETTLKWPHNSMTIRAQSADMQGAIKEPKTRNWDAVTIKSIIAKIAGEHGLQSAVDETKGAFTYKHLAQTNESDLHLLTRLGKDHDALVAIKDGNLLFTPKGAGRSVTGKAMPSRTLIPSETTSGSVTLTSRDKYKSVMGYYQDKKKGKKKEIKVGDGAPAYRIRHVYPTQEEAEKAAQSKLDEFRRGKDKLYLIMPGDASIMAEMQLILEGFRAGVDGSWSIKSVRHQQNSSGYSCHIEAEKPTKETGGDQATR